MHHFQKMALGKLCRKHHLDIQLIDDTLTFSENKDYLLSLIPKDLDHVNKGIQSQLEWYMKEHFLSYYLSVRD